MQMEQLDVLLADPVRDLRRERHARDVSDELSRVDARISQHKIGKSTVIRPINVGRDDDCVPEPRLDVRSVVHDGVRDAVDHRRK